MKKLIKPKYIIITIVILLALSATAYAATILFQANEVGYDNSNTGFLDSNDQPVEDVQTALDELYNKASTCSVRNICPSGYKKIEGSNGEYSCILKKSPKAYIENLNTEGETISTTDHYDELRFIGSNPPNYVTFNDQTWRIIGIFEGRVKLISPSIGDYLYDTSASNINNGYGVNAWEDSDLMKLLNPGYSDNIDYKCKTTTNNSECGNNEITDFEEALVNNSLYWDASEGLCYSTSNYSTKACDFRNNGLTDENSKAMIDNVTWYLGSNEKTASLWGENQIMTAPYLYNMERGNYTGKQCSNQGYCSDQVTRNDPPEWTGKVGLLYPSDYAYATSGNLTGTGTDRATCLSKQVGEVSSNTTPNWSNTYTDCIDNNWLFTGTRVWTLSPASSSNNSSSVFRITQYGYINTYNAFSTFNVRPVVYLKPEVTITRGDGTQDKPFELSYESE